MNGLMVPCSIIAMVWLLAAAATLYSAKRRRDPIGGAEVAFSFILPLIVIVCAIAFVPVYLAGRLRELVGR